MSVFEAGVALVLALISAAVGYIGVKLQSKAANKAQENIANSLLTTGYGTLVERIQKDNDDLRKRLEDADQARDEKLMGTTSLVQAKADNEYVEALEKRLDRAWTRIDATEGRLEKAEKELEDCKKEIAEQIRALETRINGEKK